MFLLHLLAMLIFLGGVIWGIIELIQLLSTQDTDAVNPFNFNCFWLIGGGIFLAISNMAAGFLSANRKFKDF